MPVDKRRAPVVADRAASRVDQDAVCVVRFAARSNDSAVDPSE